jgi:hypothetical protein
MIPERKMKELLFYKRVPVLLQQSPKYDIEKVLTTVEGRIPYQLVAGLDYVFVENSKDMKDREIEATYRDGVIYLSPDIEDSEEVVLSIVHEIAHLTEEEHPYIYQDQSIESEFLGKRKKLEEILSVYGIDTLKHDFEKIEYCENFDDFLYLQVGYPVIRGLASGLFLSPYAATSVREYFADAFEEYFIREPRYVKLISPAVYFKIEELLDSLGENFL